MAERLEREEQIAEAPPEPTVAEQHSGIAEEELLDGADVSLMPAHVQALIQRMLAGTEPYERPLKINEVKKFGPQHVNVAVLRAAGFKGKEIIQITGYGKQMVYFTLTHPYTKQLISAIVPENSTRVIDIRTRLDEYASDLLDHVFALGLKSEDVKEVKDVTFGLLDRAGYGPKKTLEVDDKRTGNSSATAAAAAQLLAAMRQSDAVNREVLPRYIPSTTPDLGLGEATPEVVDAAAESEVGPASGEGSPTSPTGPQRVVA